jgi:fructosamine-3-kinase
VPEVVLVDGDLLVTTWVDQGRRSSGHEEALGRMLATLHGAGCHEWGGGSSWVGSCPVDPSTAPDAAGFYRRRLLGLARRCGLEGQVTPLVSRLGTLIPGGEAALVHGDLWWGNVLWGADGRPWLIDPSVHGGHPEEDMAMLALFGAIPQRVLGAFLEVRSLDDGWEHRVELFQLYPLLVHAVLFDAGYRSRAEAIARRFS